MINALPLPSENGQRKVAFSHRLSSPPCSIGWHESRKGTNLTFRFGHQNRSSHSCVATAWGKGIGLRCSSAGGSFNQLPRAWFFQQTLSKTKARSWSSPASSPEPGTSPRLASKSFIISRFNSLTQPSSRTQTCTNTACNTQPVFLLRPFGRTVWAAEG